MYDAKYIVLDGGCGFRRLRRARARNTLVDQAAMAIKELLQGKWLGHPLHPALVHLPTGLWPASLIFDLLERFALTDPDARLAMELAARWCIAGGIIVALVATPAGLADWWDIKPGKAARKLGWWHMSINIVVLVLFAINLSLRWRVSPDVLLMLSVVAVALLMVSGYLGGRMVYDQGTGVARLSKKKWRKIAKAGGANLPAEE